MTGDFKLTQSPHPSDNEVLADTANSSAAAKRKFWSSAQQASSEPKFSATRLHDASVAVVAMSRKGAPQMRAPTSNGCAAT